jgi:hypothetical protein
MVSSVLDDVRRMPLVGMEGARAVEQVRRPRQPRSDGPMGGGRGSQREAVAGKKLVAPMEWLDY